MTSARSRPAAWPALVACAFAAGACRPSPPPPDAAEPTGWASALPATHEALSSVLAGLALRGPELWPPAAGSAVTDYVAGAARRGPATRPELFPAVDDRLAYLVNAHVAWTLVLGHAPELARLDVAALRERPIALDGRTTSLRRLAEEVAWRAPWEPRLALVLNAGWRGAPPLPAVALEGRSLAWQLALHAQRCGAAAGFWAFDGAQRRVALSGYADVMWGLPGTEPARARRLLDLVPPPPALRDAILTACGPSLQRCAVAAAPVDTGRLFAPPGVRK